jgi:hypothetical protein
MLLSVLVTNVGMSAAPPPVAEISITPTKIPDPGLLGHPGELYAMTVSISDVVDLWAIQFTVDFPPFVGVLWAQDFVEGPFVGAGWTYGTAFYVTTDSLAGKSTVIIMRMPGPGPRTGASGSGVLATFNFKVVESGEGSYGVSDPILLDSSVEPIPCTLGDTGFYSGTTGSLVRVNLPDGRKVKVGQTFPISAKVRNDGDVPLMVQVVLDIRRMEDARAVELWTGQTYFGGYIGAPPPAATLYCDGYSGWLEWDWNHYGDSPWLDAVGDGNLINSTINGAYSSLYTFEDISLPWQGYSVISNVDFEGYTRQDDVNNDFDPFLFTYDSEGNWHNPGIWCDSMGGSAVWAWTGGRYYKGGPYDMPEYYDSDPNGDGGIHTEQGVNSAELLVSTFDPDDPPLGLMEMDALRMIVEFATIVPVEAPVYEVGPGEELELGDIVWVSTEDHLGSYEVTATLLYSSEGFHWNSMGSKQKTLSFWIVP